MVTVKLAYRGLRAIIRSGIIGCEKLGGKREPVKQS